MALVLLLVGTVASGLACVAVFAKVMPIPDRPARPGGGDQRQLRQASDARVLPLTRKRARPPRPSVSVVVPTLNEADCLSWVLESLPPWVSEVVLVDGLSTDDTEVVARGFRSDVVIVHQSQRGKGAALRAGFAAASSDIIVMIDADGSTNPAEMGRFVDALMDGADFVKGSRHAPGGGSEDITRIRSAGNFALVKLVNLMFGSDFTDLCYGYCAFWRGTLDALALTADGFEIETELNLNAIKAGLKIREVPSFELNSPSWHFQPQCLPGRR